MRTCEAHGCTLPAGDLCFVHGGLPAQHWGDASRKIEEHDALFRLMAKMLNARPGDLVPAHTLQALREKGHDDVAELATEGMTSRQFAYRLRHHLGVLCRPANVEPVPRIADRMVAEGLKPIFGFVE